MSIDNVVNHTINGKCSQCGQCCTNVLMLSNKEIKRIKKYIEKNNIKPINRNNVLTTIYNNTCPFLSENNRCNIYEVRPEQCKHFICSEYMNNKNYFNHLDKKIINMLLTFSPGAYCPNAPDVEGMNEMYDREKKKLIGKGRL